jgi:hypothetical protein
METIRERYGPLLELVDTLLGVVPNCDPYLEIWPPALRTYNVMVPNFLNLPPLIWGLSAPSSTIGLAMYASSMSAGCPYCSAHTCTFALRRGASVEEVLNALDGGALSERDRAAVRVARALSVVPAEIEDEHRRALRASFSPKDEEWIVLAIAMMGWLNKTMDGLGVKLEEPTIAEVREVMPSGWTPGKHWDGELPRATPKPEVDTLVRRLNFVRYAPQALSLDLRWTYGVPDRWPAVGDFLRTKTGYHFPVLRKLHNRRAVRAIATMIRDTLYESAVGREKKLAAGLIFAEEIGNGAIVDAMRAIGAKPTDDAAIQKLARALAPSPTLVDADVVAACRDFAPAAIVEVVTFVSLLQMLHRLERYFGS